MTCKTCKFLDVRPDKSGRRGVRKGFTYRCLWEMPELVLADSITRYVSFPPNFPRSHMGGEDGVNCPVQEPRT